MGVEKIIEKVKKILARANPDSNNFEAEMDTALSMAHKLLAKHQLTMADIEMDESDNGICKGSAITKSSFEAWDYRLVIAVGYLTSTSSIVSTFWKDSARRRSLVFVGLVNDVALARDLHCVLRTKIIDCSRLYCKGERPIVRRSFKLGMSESLVDRAKSLKEANDLTKSEQQNYNALVLIKEDLINRYFEEKGIGKKRTNNLDIDPVSFRQGYSEGEKVNLATNVIASN